MKHLLILFSIFCTLFFCGSCNTKKIDNTVNTTLVLQQPFHVPDSIKQQAEQQLKISYVHPKSYSATFLSFFDSTYVPHQTFTDINNDNKIDYAWVVLQDNTTKIALAISNKQSYSYWLSPFPIEVTTADGINTSISIQPAGRKDIMRPIAKSLVLKKNGFLVQLLEQEQCIIYADENGKIAIFNMH
jgi:hypothetical protein